MPLEKEKQKAKVTECFLEWRWGSWTPYTPLAMTKLASCLFLPLYSYPQKVLQKEVGPCIVVCSYDGMPLAAIIRMFLQLNTIDNLMSTPGNKPEMLFLQTERWVELKNISVGLERWISG